MKASDFNRSLEKTYNEVTKVPICKCGCEMVEIYDEVAKRYTGHLWHCQRHPKMILSVG